MQIHVQRNGQSYGPYDEETARSYLAAGSLSPGDLAWREGLAAWQPLGQLLGVEPPPAPPAAVAQQAAATPAITPTPAPSLPAVTAPSALTAVAPPEPFDATALKPGRVDLMAAVRFPFREPELVKRAWWVPLIGFVPLLGVIALRGWRLDIVRRVGRGRSPALPDPGDLGRFLADGVTLWFTSIVLWAPLAALLAIFGFDGVITTLNVIWWVIQTLFTESPAAFGSVIVQALVKIAAELAIPFLYFAVLYPIYRIAAIRFALTGRLGVFLQFGRNLRLALKLLPEVMLIFFFDLLILRLVPWVIDLFLIVLGIGLFLVPLIYFPTYYWITGHLFGQVAAKVLALEEAVEPVAAPA